MTYLALTPPIALLQSSGETPIPFLSWMRAFENFVLKVNNNALSDARKLHSIYTAEELKGSISYTLSQFLRTYSAALAALTAFFMTKVNVLFSNEINLISEYKDQVNLLLSWLLLYVRLRLIVSLEVSLTK